MPDSTDISAQVRDFLVTRRNRLTPEASGLPMYGGNRRVPGLRREEVALLAGMSVDYYVRLERGNLSGASESVLESLASALQLDDAERAHLYDLVRSSSAGRARRDQDSRRSSLSRPRPTLLRILDAMPGTPAYLRNGRFDILAANQLGRALYAPVFDSPLFAQRGPINTARFLFLDPVAQDFWVDWNTGADDSVAFLRSEAGRSPQDRVLTELIGELSTRSQDFATRWAKHDVKVPPGRRQAPPPPRRRRAQPPLRGHGSPRRPRPPPQHLHPSAGLSRGRSPRLAGQLDPGPRLRPLNGVWARHFGAQIDVGAPGHATVPHFLSRCVTQMDIRPDRSRYMDPVTNPYRCSH